MPAPVVLCSVPIYSFSCIHIKLRLSYNAVPLKTHIQKMIKFYQSNSLIVFFMIMIIQTTKKQIVLTCEVFLSPIPVFVSFNIQNINVFP